VQHGQTPLSLETDLEAWQPVPLVDTVQQGTLVPIVRQLGIMVIQAYADHTVPRHEAVMLHRPHGQGVAITTLTEHQDRLRPELLPITATSAAVQVVQPIMELLAAATQVQLRRKQGRLRLQLVTQQSVLQMPEPAHRVLRAR
jgi:hypothetical protein